MHVISIYKGDVEIGEKSITPLKAISIGRHKLNDICLPDDQHISRFHAALFLNEDGIYYLQDLGSRNGVYVNKKKKDSGALNIGDEIKVGNYTLILKKQADKSQTKKPKVELSYSGPKDDAKTVFSPFTQQWKDISEFKDDAEGLLLLYKLNHFANADYDIEEALQLITEELSTILQPDRVIIALIEQQGANLTCLARFPQDTIIKVSRTMIQFLLQEKQVLATQIGDSCSTSEKQVIVSNDLSSDDRFKNDGSLAPSIMELKLKSAILAPLQWDGEIKGILYVDCSGKTKIFTEREVNLISLAANDISSLIERDAHYTDMENENTRLENLVDIENTIIGISSKTKEILENIKKFSDTETPILITGETGTGKDLAAKVIHNNSRRKGKPFIHINCAAIPNELLESDLFGVIANYPGFHNKEELKGKFALADGGTLFLDEIGELSLKLQAKLLHVLGEYKKLKEIWPLGAINPTIVDVRIIAATNRNLKQAVDKRRFREDLYERLNILSFHMPPLRERKEDIPLLAGYFLYKFRQDYEKKINRFSNTCIEYLSSYEWPGNVRELQYAVLKAVILANRPTINKDLFDLKNDWKPKSLEEMEKEHIKRVLKYTGGNKRRAAPILDICIETLYKKGRKYCLVGFEGQSTTR